MTGDSLKQRLLSGNKQLGLVVLLPSADVAEILGHAGVDMVMIDHEHGGGGLADFVAQDRALAGSGTLSMVRVPHGELAYAQRLLDNGAQAIVYPGVDTAEQAIYEISREVGEAWFELPGTELIAGARAYVVPEAPFEPLDTDAEDVITELIAPNGTATHAETWA